MGAFSSVPSKGPSRGSQMPEPASPPLQRLSPDSYKENWEEGCTGLNHSNPPLNLKMVRDASFISFWRNTYQETHCGNQEPGCLHQNPGPDLRLLWILTTYLPVTHFTICKRIIVILMQTLQRSGHPRVHEGMRPLRVLGFAQERIQNQASIEFRGKGVF